MSRKWGEGQAVGSPLRQSRTTSGRPPSRRVWTRMSVPLSSSERSTIRCPRCKGVYPISPRWTTISASISKQQCRAISREAISQESGCLGVRFVIDELANDGHIDGNLCESGAVVRRRRGVGDSCLSQAEVTALVYNA